MINPLRAGQIAAVPYITHGHGRGHTPAVTWANGEPPR
jgi:hypothetical protein